MLYTVEPVEDSFSVLPLVYMKMVDNRLDSVKYSFADFSDLRFSWIEKETSMVVSKVGFANLKAYEFKASRLAVV